MLHVSTVLIAQPDGSIDKHSLGFGGFKRDCRALAARLVELEVQIAVMESTGIYWKSVFAHMENAGIAAWVVNAHFVKHVPGCKTDMLDSEWLAVLARFGRQVWSRRNLGGFHGNVLYLLKLQRAFEAIDPPLRPIAPGLVWLFLMPVFNLVWSCFFVNSLKSLYAKIAAAGRMSAPTTAGFGVGPGFAVGVALTIVPGINLLSWIPAIVPWIVRWVQASVARKLVLPASAPNPI